MEQTTRRQLTLAAIALTLAMAAVQVSSQRQPSGVRGFKSPCGSAESITQRIGQCLTSVVEMIEGRFPSPTTDNELNGLCNRFTTAERCIRGISKECLAGIHKTTVGALASGMKRFQKQECKDATVRAKYMSPLQCLTRRSQDLVPMFRNYTSIAQGLRDLPNVTPEKKLIRFCCLLNEVDRGVISTMSKDCPENASLITSIIHAITDDARNTICINPKCQNAFSGVLGRAYIPPQNLIEPATQIMLTLATD